MAMSVAQAAKVLDKLEAKSDRELHMICKRLLGEERYGMLAIVAEILDNRVRGEENA